VSPPGLVSCFGFRVPRFIFSASARVPCVPGSGRPGVLRFLTFAYFDLRPFLGVILITLWFLSCFVIVSRSFHVSRFRFRSLASALGPPGSGSGIVSPQGSFLFLFLFRDRFRIVSCFAFQVPFPRQGPRAPHGSGSGIVSPQGSFLFLFLFRDRFKIVLCFCFRFRSPARALGPHMVRVRESCPRRARF
jgi:hypothetical protein